MTPKKQTGAALIVSLLMLTIMTMIGVTAMQSNLLQEKMAGNFRDTNLAFQAAEAGLRDGEADVSIRVTGLTGFNSSCSNGLCDATSGFNSVWKDTGSGDTEDNGVTYGSNTGAIAIANVSCQPRYWIEGFKSWPAGSPSWKVRYRITSTGCGGNADTRVTVQSVFSP